VTRVDFRWNVDNKNLKKVENYRFRAEGFGVMSGHASRICCWGLKKMVDGLLVPP
jgi:hypothetical protein